MVTLFFLVLLYCLGKRFRYEVSEIDYKVHLELINRDDCKGDKKRIKE